MNEKLPIGRVIDRARQRKRWTQVELAERVGVHELTVVAWEKGRFYPRRNIVALEEALEISLAEYETAAS
jgi:ribosome-binding protein aMBF1 (putative translation factor)